MHSIYAQARPDLQLAHRKYSGREELFEVLEHGYLYEVDGVKPRRIAPSERTKRVAHQRLRSSFVTSLQTHDSVGNHPGGKRLHHLTSKDYQKAAAAMVLLQPSIPQIFMGEETAHSSPFPFFVNFEDVRLQASVAQGRIKEYPQHQWEDVVSPIEDATFELANLDSGQADESMLAWYQSLLRLRRQGLAEGWLDVERLKVAYSPEDQLYTLQYVHGECTITIFCRLALKQSKPTEVVIDDGADILLDSHEPALQAGSATIANLQPCHTLVIRAT